MPLGSCCPGVVMPLGSSSPGVVISETFPEALFWHTKGNPPRKSVTTKNRRTWVGTG
jgi:hypothetical protein